jgi:hypothetical protein
MTVSIAKLIVHGSSRNEMPDASEARARREFVIGGIDTPYH